MSINFKLTSYVQGDLTDEIERAWKVSEEKAFGTIDFDTRIKIQLDTIFEKCIDELKGTTKVDLEKSKSFVKRIWKRASKAPLQEISKYVLKIHYSKYYKGLGSDAASNLFFHFIQKHSISREPQKPRVMRDTLQKIKAEWKKTKTNFMKCVRQEVVSMKPAMKEFIKEELSGIVFRELPVN